MTMPIGNAKSHINGKRHKKAVSYLLPQEGIIMKLANDYDPKRSIRIKKFKKPFKKRKLWLS